MKVGVGMGKQRWQGIKWNLAVTILNLNGKLKSLAL